MFAIDRLKTVVVDQHKNYAEYFVRATYKGLVTGIASGTFELIG